MEPIVQANMERVESVILVLRGRKVIIDADLARLYGVPTKVLNQAVARNFERFPSDFLFRLTQEEKNELVTGCDRFRNLKHSTSLPNAFTEFGAIMAANVLNSEPAVRASVFVVRAFLRMRETLIAGAEIGLKLSEIERRLDGHDDALREVISTIRELKLAKPRPTRTIGFKVDGDSA
jgi:hypothetical protein